MVKKEGKGNDQRQSLEEIVRGDEAKQAASDGEDSDDPDPYAASATADSWQVTTYIYDITAPYYEVLSETTDGKTTTYDYGVERLAAYTSGAWNAQKVEYVYDGRGSVAQEVGYNNSWYTFGGKIGKASVVSKSYSPFGEMFSGKTSGFGFNGEYYDSATGMLNLRARQYEPAQMRFGQHDLLKGDAGIPLSLNRYLYCANDPVNFADVDGMAKAKTSIFTKAATKIKNLFTPSKKTTTTTKQPATKVNQTKKKADPISTFLKGAASVVAGLAVTVGTGGNVVIGVAAGLTTYKALSEVETAVERAAAKSNASPAPTATPSPRPTPTPTPTPSPSPTLRPVVQTVTDNARSKIGTKYSQTDCSDLVEECYA